MKNSVSLSIFSLLLAFNIQAQYLWQVFPDKVVKWNYYDGDEFNKEKLDETKWITSQPWGRPVHSQEIIYVKDNVVFENGIAQFQIRKENKLFELYPWEFDTASLRKDKIPLVDGNKINFKYSGGLLWSKKKYKYGYFEIKFKASEGQGIWPAFWLYGANPNNEIDFYELKGEKEKTLHVDIHCPDGCSNYIDTWYGYRKSWGHWVEISKRLSEEYNVVSGEWTADYIKWYFNGMLMAYSNHSYDLDMWL
ncbi:MAG: family 16 glycosylhydrolase, partial [Bacteroidia bacterium]|nr:family 16 glycosylhydrolase [Bacteroidia bacterium]